MPVIHKRVLLAPVLLAALLARPARAVEIDRCLPDDAELVVCVNVRQLLDAPVVKKHFVADVKTAWERDGFKPRQTAERLKFDPFKDVSSITLAGPAKRGDEKALLIIRGRFDVEALETAAEIYANRGADDFKMHKQDGQRYFEFKLPRTERTAFVAVVDKETLLLSPSREALLTAAGRQRNQKPAQPAKELRALLEKVDGKETIWLAAIVSEEIKKDLVNNPQVRKTVEGLQSMRGGITVGDGIKADLIIQTSDQKTSGEVRKVLEGIQSLISLAVMDNDRYAALPADLVGSLKVATDKETVTIKGGLNAEQIEKSLKSKPTDSK